MTSTMAQEMTIMPVHDEVPSPYAGHSITQSRDVTCIAVTKTGERTNPRPAWKISSVIADCTIKTVGPATAQTPSNEGQTSLVTTVSPWYKA